MYDMFEEMRRMQDEMDRMFDGFFRVRRPMLAGPKGKTGKELERPEHRSPVCNVCEIEKNILATFEIPGVDKADINLNVTENSIEVSAKRRVEKEVKKDKEGQYSYYAAASQFYRHLPLPKKVEPDKAKASYKDGVLRVEMPKARLLTKDKGHNVLIE